MQPAIWGVKGCNGHVTVALAGHVCNGQSIISSDRGNGRQVGRPCGTRHGNLDGNHRIKAKESLLRAAGEEKWGKMSSTTATGSLRSAEPGGVSAGQRQTCL